MASFSQKKRVGRVYEIKNENGFLEGESFDFKDNFFLGDQKMVKTAPQGSPGKQVCTYLKCASTSLCHGISLSKKKEGRACVRNQELKWFLGGGLF
jgi:hypothetical protein